MCKEDIRIKRKTAANSRSAVATGNDYVAFFAGRPDRVTLTAGIKSGVWLSEMDYICVVAGLTTDAPVIGVISPGQPSITLRVEDIGTLVTFPIGLVNRGGDEPQVSVTEVFFTEALSDV